MAFLNDLTPQQIVARLVAYLMFCAVHGAVLAGLARLLGDAGPKHAGRLTLNPFAHVTAGGAAMTALFLTGWIRPMAIDPARLRGGRWALAGLTLAALAAMLALVPLLDLVRPGVVQTFEQTWSYYLLFLIVQFQQVAISSAALNLLPLPVLTGHLFLVAAAPHLAPRIRRAEPVVAALLVLTLVAGWVPDVAPVLAPLLSLTQ